MQVILKQDMNNLGQKDDIVNVKNGYALNYLIPKGYAINATPSALKMHAETMRQRAHKEARIREEAIELSKKLEGVSLEIGAKTSTKGKIFGSVNTIQISEALAEKGFDVDRRNILIKEELIKEVGKYTATIRLHKDVKVEIPFEIKAE